MRILALALGVAALAGCSGRLPAVKPPSMDLDAAANGAIAMFDSDQDGVISRGEACPGMTKYWKRYDQDEDGSSTLDELKTRFERWSGGDTGLMNMRVEVKYRGQSLDGAEVRMTPYEFLGENFLPSEGVTDRYGFAFVAIPRDLLPKSQQNTFGMQVGLYKVSITHPSLDLPAKYNTETELSVDLSPQEADTGIGFELK